MGKKRAAFCLRGAVSKTQGNYIHIGTLYTNPCPYVNYKITYNSIVKHIVNVNPDYDIDFFIHCWNEDLQESLVSLYKPVSYLFEDNRKYEDEIKSKCRGNDNYGGISHALSIKKVLELQENYSNNNKINYDIVVLFRPDILIWKDISFPKYDLNNFYIDGSPDCCGEMYFVMSFKHSLLFKDLYLSVEAGNPYRVHLWTKLYLINYCKIPIRMDDLIPGRDCEVLRKIDKNSIILKPFLTQS